MMLDNNAEELTKEELPEIMSYLPDYTGKRIIELGAGIGADLVFSNWLLMYLEDKEVQQLLAKLLSWLAPGGYLFIRESCRHPSGDKSRSSNPTQYRDPALYEAFLASTTIPRDAESVYGFDMVLSKSVETYIKRKNNSNQVVWLVQKVKRDASKTYGFKTFQEFLDNQQYSANGILRYEKIFGRTFVSTGGLETTKEFVDMLKLRPGQKVLDVGGGIGGSAFYMAKEFGVKVVSIDLSSNMTQIGLERARELGMHAHGSIDEVYAFQEFCEEDYNYIVNGWKDKLVRVGEGDQRWGLFYAEKP
nr:hypothetical protein BaRGS_021827 [Batillaria attramentaria]